MKLTKLTHAGVKLVKDGATLVIDPGSFPSGTQALSEELSRLEPGTTIDL